MIICLDTNCVIYLIEKNPTWEPKVTARLAAATLALLPVGYGGSLWAEAEPRRRGRSLFASLYRPCPWCSPGRRESPDPERAAAADCRPHAG
jgi:hypothetical protein